MAEPKKERVQIDEFEKENCNEAIPKSKPNLLTMAKTKNVHSYSIDVCNRTIVEFVYLFLGKSRKLRLTKQKYGCKKEN